MIHKNWQELIKPTQLVVKPGNDASRVATVIAEPLERGGRGRPQHHRHFVQPPPVDSQITG